MKYTKHIVWVHLTALLISVVNILLTVIIGKIHSITKVHNKINESDILSLIDNTLNLDGKLTGVLSSISSGAILISTVYLILMIASIFIMFGIPTIGSLISSRVIETKVNIFRVVVVIIITFFTYLPSVIISDIILYLFTLLLSIDIFLLHMGVLLITYALMVITSIIMIIASIIRTKRRAKDDYNGRTGSTC